MESIVSKQVNYKVRHESAPKYKLMKIALNNPAGDSLNISSNAQQLLEFRVPAGVYNLARSYVTYTETIPGQGAGVYSWMYVGEGQNLVNSVTFGTGANFNICELQFAQNYCRVAVPAETPLEDYLTNDVADPLFKSDLAAASNYRANTLNIQSTNPYYLGEDQTYKAGIINYLEPRHLQVSGDDAANAHSFKLRLDNFPNTVLGVDRDFLSPIDMYLRLNVGGANKIGFSSTSATNPTAGAAALTGNVAVSNIYLYLCVETNQNIVNALLEKYAQGELRMQIPMTVGFTASPSGTQQNVNLMVNRAYGKRLKKIIYTVFNGTETLNNAYNNSNWNGSRVVAFNTYINSQPLHDSLIYCLQTGSAGLPGGSVGQEDWLVNELELEGSVYINGAYHQSNWVHIEDFTSSRLDDDKIVPDANVEDGLDLSLAQSMTFQFNAQTTNGTYNHYAWFVFLRDIVITPTGPVFTDVEPIPVVPMIPSVPAVGPANMMRR